MKSLLLFIAAILLSLGLAAGPSLQPHTSGAEDVDQGVQDVAVPHTEPNTKPHTTPGTEAEHGNGRSNRQWQHNWMGP